MPDVMTHCIVTNPIKNNSSVSAVMANGTYHVKQFGTNEIAPSGAVDAKYTNRFDDPTFYTA